MIKDYKDCCDMYLFDTMGAGYGGTGKKFNWEVMRDLDIQKPFFLSGGIEPNDVHSIREFTQQPVAKDLFAVDINSRFEIAPGVKDLGRVREFFEGLNGT
jgi:phosphoribosylanthranilate isomerase